MALPATLEPTDPALSSLLGQQMTAVTRSWTGLAQALAEAKARLSCVRQTSGEFEQLLGEAHTAVERLSDKLTALPAATGIDPVWIEEQLSICAVSVCLLNILYSDVDKRMFARHR